MPKPAFSILPLLLALLSCTLVLHPPGALARDNAPIRAAVAVDGDTPPATAFPADTPKLTVFFLGDGVAKGDVLRCVWLADDVGDAAPKGTKIDESTIMADKDKFQGGFTLSKPTAGWPIGKYRADLYLNGKLTLQVPFSIQAASAGGLGAAAATAK